MIPCRNQQVTFSRVVHGDFVSVLFSSLGLFSMQIEKKKFVANTIHINKQVT